MKIRTIIKKYTFLCIMITSILLTSYGCQMPKHSSQNVKKTKDSIINNDYKAFIDKADNYLTSCEFQGTVLVGKHDDILFAKGYGSSDKKDKNAPKNTMNTTYEAGSITKQMTAGAILQLQEQGKLSVDDKLSKYFPEYKYGDDITLRMLLTMRSGLSDFINDPERFFGEKVAKELADKEWNGEPVDRDIVMKYFYDAPLFSKPNERFNYCNTNFYLLGLVIEQVSGMTYEDYMQKNIFDKCDMTSTNTKLHGTTSKGYDASGHYYSIPENIGLACGDVNTSAGDLFKWDRALVNGTVISKDSFKEMRASQTYGYGVYADSYTVLHGGSTDVFNSYNIIYLKDDVTIVVLINEPIEDSSSTIIAGNLRKLYVAENYEE